MKRSKKIVLTLLLLLIAGLFVPLIALNTPMAADKIRQHLKEEGYRATFARHQFSLLGGFTFVDVKILADNATWHSLSASKLEARPNHFFFLRGLPAFAELKLEAGVIETNQDALVDDFLTTGENFAGLKKMTSSVTGKAVVRSVIKGVVVRELPEAPLAID